MGRIFIAIVLAAGALWLPVRAFAQDSKAPAPSPSNTTELSYALGYEAGRDLGRHRPDVDIATVVRGVQDGFLRHKPAYSPQQMQQVIQAMQKQMIAEARAAFAKVAADNLRKSHAFFTRNAKQPGVVSLPSGVQYLAIGDAGSGESPTLSSEVTLQYRGEFLDGTVFDNTEDRGKPVVFPVNQMIPGWREVITRMRVGDHWKVFIPPEQAYGIRGEPPRIGPNEALVFDIRLLGARP